MNAELRQARRRQMVIFLLVSCGMLVLLGRLYYWQVLQSHSGYNLAQQANQEHLQNEPLDAPRGLIFDSRGHVLATNVLRDDVYVEPMQFSIDHPENNSDALDSLVNSLHSVLTQVPVEKLRHAFTNGIAHDLGAVRVAVGIDPKQSQQLRALQLPDVFLQPRTWRVYPGGTLAAQILGYVTQFDTNNHGHYGIEELYDTLLSGKPGSLTAETDLQGNPLVLGADNEQPAISGANLTLTIDSNIEYMVESALASAVQKLDAQSGTVVVINVHTGAVAALAGYPTFDPNKYSQYASTNGCLGTEEVYFNPALYCAYEPGSTMKAVTMAAALDQGLITPDTTIDDQGCIDFPDVPQICNWRDIAYGPETMTQVLEHSANVGASYVAYNILGAQRYYPYLVKFGFGQATGIDGPEYPGMYRKPGDSGWTISDLTRQSFGQSILATPLQVAMAYEAIANGGVMMEPYLVSGVDNNGQVTTTQPIVKRRVISQHAAQLLIQMLTQSAAHGFAQLAQVPGYSVAAKTGTATTQGISADQTEASVAGFLPASNPQFVILVKLDRPQKAIYGSTAAAPLWGYIAQQLMWYYQVPPDMPQ
ncbi:MAG TPA: penicillin-binding protein 2 [Ktedonobacteraceae bacterium]|jgi:cell division protein FtsI/penicillin-binding protein 2|nr:penicillin-binding protein 2 [Ktedonobacteraceae bacterium]